MSANKNMSLYIPHVFPNFDKEFVAKAFKNIGEVSQIDFVAKQDRNGKNFNAVYVHFNKWFTSKRAVDFHESLMNETTETRFYYDGPWFWIVLPNTAKKHIPGERKARIDLGESKSIAAPKPATSLMPLSAFFPRNVCPKAPQKRSYADVTMKPMDDLNEVKKSLESTFDEVAEFEAKIEAEMDEIEELLEEDDENLVRIDGRYVQELEQENCAMTTEIAQLRAALINLDMMYQAEAAKVRAFTTTSIDL
jgi:hypothetical protein